MSNGGGGRLQWSTVSARVAGRSDWKREGSDLRGPCPVTFAGGRTCWIGEGVDGGIRLGCHHCGGRLDGPAYVEHARALGLLDGAAFPGARRPAAPLPRPVEPLPALGPDPAVSHVWNAAQPIQANDPGGVYLRRRLSGWIADRPFPSELVRWLPAGRVRIWPVPPAAAAGVLVYGFRASAESVPGAVQFEAVDVNGERVMFDKGAKRPGLNGCNFAQHRRVFWAAPGRPGGGAVVVEGPIDALAVLELDRLGVVTLGHRAAIGVAGVGGFRLEAVDRIDGEITIAPDGDRAGVLAGAALRVALGRFGRVMRWAPTPGGGDWCDYLEAETERRALRDD